MIHSRPSTLAVIFALALAGSEARPAPFQNLNFESPVPPLSVGGDVPVTNAFPGWHVYAGPLEYYAAAYNTFALSLADV